MMHAVFIAAVLTQQAKLDRIIASLVENHFALTGPSREESEKYLRDTDG